MFAVRLSQAISPYIPTENPALSGALYEMILTFFLREDPPGFLNTIRTWPHQRYNVQNVITLVTDVLKTDPNNQDLMEALADLCARRLAPFFSRAIFSSREIWQAHV